MVFQHSLYIQVFHTDNLVFVNQCIGNLMQIVLFLLIFRVSLFRFPSLPAKDIDSKSLSIIIIERQVSCCNSRTGRRIITMTSTSLSFVLLIGIPERILAMQRTERLRVLFLEKSLSAYRTGNHRTYL